MVDQNDHVVCLTGSLGLEGLGSGWYVRSSIFSGGAADS